MLASDITKMTQHYWNVVHGNQRFVAT